MTDLVPAGPTEAQHFDLVVRQADVLAASKIVPAAYRRSAPDIIAAGLAGRAFGWDVMSSLRNFHVIEGTASMRPEAMLGLVRQHGHSVQVHVDGDAAVAKGRRGDNGDEHTARFTMADAAAAGLAKKKNWSQYQDAMLTWRAVSALCRVLFPDVVLGAGYVPEELGAPVDQTGNLAETIDDEETAAIHDRIDALDGFQRDELRDWWKSEGLPKLDGGLTVDQAELVFARLYDLEDTGIVDGEVVEPEAEPAAGPVAEAQDFLAEIAQ